MNLGGEVGHLNHKSAKLFNSRNQIMLETYVYLLFLLCILFVLSLITVAVELYINYKQHKYHARVMDKVITKI